MPYQVYDFQIFYPISWIVFLTFLVTFFEAQTGLILILISFISCVTCAFGVIFRFLKTYVCVFKSFVVLACIFMLMMHFDLIFL